MKEFLSLRQKAFTKIEIDNTIKNEITNKKLRKKIESILNIRVILALTYLKDYYQCINKYFYI